MKTPAVWFPAVRARSGADVFTERLCLALKSSGIRAEITWLPLRAEYAPWSVPVSRPPNWSNIVHINTWLHPRFVPWHLGSIATVHHCVHDPDLEPFKTPCQKLYHRYWIRRIEASILKHVTMVTAVSRYSSLRTQEVFDCTNIEVIHNGIDMTIFFPGQRDRPHRPFRLLYVGNWLERKGVELIGPIMQTLGSGFELHYTADRNGRHQRYSLPSNCHCQGRLSKTGLIKAYQNADALLFPSRLEGFGLVVAEAMACALPVIAGYNSALPEVVAHGVSGLLCTPHHSPAFVEACRSLAQDLEQWRKMRQAARKRVIAHFNEQQQSRKYVEMYQVLLAGQESSL